jgi:hypothetical protein
VRGRANDGGHRARPSRWPSESDLWSNETDLLSRQSDFLSNENDLPSIDFVRRTVAVARAVAEL